MIVAIYAALIFLLMMAVPRDSEAECAWVLWSILGGVGVKQEMNALGAYGTEYECGEGKVAMDKMPRAPQPQGRKDQYYLWSFVCLPDTIDPRGPKGR